MKPNWQVTPEGRLKDMNTKQYPLIEELGLRPFHTEVRNIVVSADELEAVLQKGVRLYGRLRAGENLKTLVWDKDQVETDTHTSLLIGVKELTQKSREDEALDLLRELVSKNKTSKDIANTLDRARALLAKRGEEL